MWVCGYSDLLQDSAKSVKVDTRQEVIKAVGVLSDTLRKLVVGKLTVNAVYNQIKREALGYILGMHPRAENTTYVMLCG